MMEVIRQDFFRTIQETQLADRQAIEDHRKFTEATDASITEKNIVEADWKEQQASQAAIITSSTEALDEASGVVKAQIEELKKLQPVCIDTGMTYEERVERREQEVEALKQALCIFEGHTNG